jgi:hypothetical protein
MDQSSIGGRVDKSKFNDNYIGLVAVSFITKNEEKAVESLKKFTELMRTIFPELKIGWSNSCQCKNLQIAID